MTTMCKQNVARVSSGAAPDGNAGPRPRHTGRALRPASAKVRVSE